MYVDVTFEALSSELLKLSEYFSQIESPSIVRLLKTVFKNEITIKGIRGMMINWFSGRAGILLVWLVISS